MSDQVDVSANCGQCGNPYRSRACGPTHAMIFGERNARAKKRRKAKAKAKAKRRAKR